MKDDLNEAELMLKGYTEKMQDQEQVLKRQENQAADEISSNISNPACSVQPNSYSARAPYFHLTKVDSPTTPTPKQRRTTDLEFVAPTV